MAALKVGNRGGHEKHIGVYKNLKQQFINNFKSGRTKYFSFNGKRNRKD
jgi:hypothetical protein